jgi:hypothetical protein
MVKTAKQKTKFKRHHKIDEDALVKEPAMTEVAAAELEDALEVEPDEEQIPAADENTRHEEFADLDSALEGDVIETENVIEPGETEEPEDKPSNSVVADKFKQNYIANAREQGLKGKAPRRSNWDWLAQAIAKECLDQKHKIDINKFLAILEANDIDYKKWPNRNRGWEGRLRMTGRVALQRIVADNNVLKMPGGEDMVPPADFVTKFKTKE